MKSVFFRKYLIYAFLFFYLCFSSRMESSLQLQREKAIDAFKKAKDVLFKMARTYPGIQWLLLGELVKICAPNENVVTFLFATLDPKKEASMEYTMFRVKASELFGRVSQTDIESLGRVTNALNELAQNYTTTKPISGQLHRKRRQMYAKEPAADQASSSSAVTEEPATKRCLIEGSPVPSTSSVVTTGMPIFIQELLALSDKITLDKILFDDEKTAFLVRCISRQTSNELWLKIPFDYPSKRANIAPGLLDSQDFLNELKDPSVKTITHIIGKWEEAENNEEVNKYLKQMDESLKKQYG